MKNQFILGICLFIISSCGNETNSVNTESGEVSSAIAANEASEEDLKASLKEIEKEEQALAKEAQATSTTMSFDKMTNNFGKIKEDTDHNASFIVTNTGKNPLIIEKVDVSCGCTTAKKPEKPIMPGKSDKIEVVFHPKVGQLNEQNKTITITANTNPTIAVLNIEAFVIK
jgi:hypothetical protein